MKYKKKFQKFEFLRQKVNSETPPWAGVGGGFVKTQLLRPNIKA